MKYMLLCYDDAEAWERAGEGASGRRCRKPCGW